MTREEWLEIGYEKGLISDIPDDEGILFKDVFKMWFKSKINTIKPQSIDRLENVYKKYYKGTSLDDMYIHNITEVTINDFMNNIILNNPINKKEYQRIFQIVNNVLKYAADCRIGHVQDIKWTFVKRFIAVDNLVESKKQEYVIPMSDQQAIFRAVICEKLLPDMQATAYCVCLNFYLGLRIGELSGLKWNDVDLINRFIYVHSNEIRTYARDETGDRVGSSVTSVADSVKTKMSTRRVPLIQDAVKLLYLIQEWQHMHNIYSEYVCYDGDDVIISNRIERCIKTLCKKLQLRKFTSHMIRKTFASNLHYAGVPTKIISDVMGHAHISTTESCYILSVDDGLAMCRACMENLKIKVLPD